MPVKETLGSREKHEAILAAALTLFGHYGYRRTSIDDIAQEAGIAKGTVYLYFRSKEEIFRALSQQLLDQVLSAAEEAVHADNALASRLRGLMEAKFGYFFDLMHQSAHVRELIDAKNELCADLFAQADRRYVQMLTKTIATAVAAKELQLDAVDLDVAAAAELLIRSASGLGTYGATPLTQAAFRRHLHALVRVFVVGLGGTIRV
jgi:TetR/AcrR family transcriptional regulator, regulator of autoinduction and epiphytic fitness